MRYCQTCQRTYANEDLRFCLEDGGELVAWVDPEATLVSPQFPSTPTRVVPLAPLTTPTAPAYQTPPPVAASGGAWGWKIAVGVLGLALAGVLVWAVALRGDNAPARVVQSTDQPEIRVGKPTPKPAATTPKPEPTPTAPPAEALSPEEIEAAETGVEETLNAWSSALKAHDLDEFLSHYAERLEVYYLHRNWTREQVREDKARAFDKYYETDGSVSDLSVEVAPSGQRATARFLKTYSFRNDEKDFSGETRAEFTLIKSNGRWLIAGERDLE
jgi:ketosteroid isomerase-like protein